MKLENIGFYTLSDYRAGQTSTHSPLWRCELLLTNRCNFNCSYCRKSGPNGNMDFDYALSVVRWWCASGLKNVRFSGGEPLLYPWLGNLVQYCEDSGVERIAISTNGSANLSQYLDLIDLGVNDFSISLDGCCASTAETISGRKGFWDRLVRNIKELSQRTYVTVGVVFTPENIDTALETVYFASSLGVADIRVIPSAQYNAGMDKLVNVDNIVLDKHPILKYRVSRAREGRLVRGIPFGVRDRCWLMLDDMVVSSVGNNLYHYPCIIHLREGGDPIGKFGPDIRSKREDFLMNHKPWEDPICLKNCLDVCVDYNRRVSGTKDSCALPISKEA